MGSIEDQRAQKLVIARLHGMGLRAQTLPGGRCALVELPLRPAPFPSIEGPQEFSTLRFATVGPNQIKCLAPEPLFLLPLISVVGCTTPDQIEDRVRSAWAAHGRGLRRAQDELRRLGVQVESEGCGAMLGFGLGLEDGEARARVWRGRQICLPSRGSLSGRALATAGERLFEWSPSCESATDLEIATTQRLEQLERREERRERRARQRRASGRVLQPPSRVRRTPPGGSGYRVLLVGALLGRDAALIDGLRKVGFRVEVEYTTQDALAAFDRQSFDVALTDAHLGRSEGLELVPAIDELPGIGHVPIVLVDEHPRDPLREAARRLGAAGYLVHPLKATRVAPGLARLAEHPRARRFERLDCRLTVAGERFADGFTTSIGRMGMFLRCNGDLAAGERGRFEIQLPEHGRAIRVDAEARYRVDAAGARDGGVGLRFRGFPDRDESLWIDYVAALAAA